MAELDDIVRDFLVESHEGLDRLDQDFVALEQNPSDPDRLASIFRCIHTIKGTCGFLGFICLETVTHAGENLLSKLRDGDVVLSTRMASTLLRLVDAVRETLARIESTGTDKGSEYGDLIPALNALLNGDADATAAAESPAADAAPAAEAVDGGEAKAHVADSTLRVDVGLLDRLMNLVGELVLARNQILQSAVAGDEAAFAATSARLNLITTELQEGVMKTRMQPIGNLWSKLPRVVRDLATATGKQIRLELDGKETELDKTIIEAIKDPLTHLVRNACDHGIEKPAARGKAKKSAEGVLRLRAYHEGGQVNIEVTDDGAGIDPEKIRAKAVQKGLVPADQAARMAEREVLNLIFAAGFSTAEQVTNVSGRGVGMDVVKTNIEKIGGTVDVQSVPGAGTTFKIKIPLTLAIIPALIVSGGGERFAIPQVSLLELVRLDGEQAESGIEMIHGAPVYRLRGNLLPLVYLHKALRLPTTARERGDAVNIVVLQADERPFGLVVDAVHDSGEIVVKPLGRHLKGLATFAGATIMGDGAVALILDVMGLAQVGAVVSGAAAKHKTDTTHAAAAQARQTVLIASVGERRLAVPLSAVARLEEFPRTKIERSGAIEVVQYRGGILPLIRVAGLIGAESSANGAMVPVVVHAANGKDRGLVVDRILDIVEDHIVIEERAGSPGIAGSAVIQGRVTDLLDLNAAAAA